MSRNLRIRTVVTIGLFALLAGVLVTAYGRAESREPPDRSDVTHVLGAAIPPLTLRSVDGVAVPLAGLLSRGPSLIIVLGGNDCFSCSSYQLELEILKAKLPGVLPIIIGSGPEEQLFRDYFKQGHLEAIALLDKDRVLLTALRVESEPLVLLVDTAGRILFVDARSSSAAAQFPFGRLLPLLGGALQTVPSSISRTGEPN